MRIPAFDACRAPGLAKILGRVWRWAVSWPASLFAPAVFFLVVMLIVAGDMRLSQAQEAPPAGAAPVPGVPSIRILKGTPISPADAAAHYGAATTSTDGLCRDYSSNAQICPGGVRPRAPEIVELARALRNDPDLIYEYVRNSVDTEFAFGLHEGALGVVIDGSGGPFDQTQLMVELLRAAGFAARYKFGDITLNSDQFYDWSGFRQARASCEYLAAGGIPALVNGVSGSCDISGDVTTITLAHVWVEVDLPGGTYLFDPSFKPYEHIAGIDVRAGMGLQQGAALSAVTQGFSQTGGGRTVSNFNQPALRSLLQGYTTQLLARFRQTDMHGAGMAEVIGGDLISPAVRPQNGWRQTSLAHIATTRATWASIPDQFRTVVQVTRKHADSSISAFATMFLDEIAGRRLEIDHERGAGYAGTGIGKPQVLFDHVPIFTSPQPYDPGHRLRLIVSINHPFAGSSGGYGDDAFERRIVAANPATIVYGQSRTTPRWGAKWGEEQAQDREGVEYASITTNPDSGEMAYVYSFGDRARALASTEWLAQFTAATDIHARLAGARAHQLHTIGLVYALHDMETLATPGSYGYAFGMGPVEVLDLQTAAALTSLTSDQPARRAGLHAIAATAATLEGSVFEQSSNNPDAASTARRAAWGDEPEAQDTHMPSVTRSFRSYAPTDALPAASELLLDGSLNGPNVNGAPLLSWVAGYKQNTIDTISAYQQQGFGLVVSMDVALGPGNLHDGRGGALSSRERGNAMVAVRYDANGDPTEIAHVLMTPWEQTKGGGGFTVTDPPETASILRTRFVDRSSQLGVNLSDGTAGYTSSVVRSVGHGDYPYRLDERLEIAAGPAGRADHVGNSTYGGVPRGHQPWLPTTGDLVSSFFGAATLTNSGLEAMGSSRIEGAAATLVSFAAMQDVWRASPAPEREIAGLLVANWWADALIGNVVIVRTGASSAQYVRTISGEYLPSNNDGSRLGGNFTMARGLRGSNPYPDPPAAPNITTPDAYLKSPRFWGMTPTSGPLFLQVDRSGDVTEYEMLAPSGPEVPTYTFGVTRSVFASGVILSYAYSSDPDVRQLTSVTSNLGYTLTLSAAPWTYNFDPESLPSFQNACLSWTDNIASPLATVDRVFTDASAAQYKVRFRAPVRRTLTQRPMDACRLEAVFAPSDQTTPSTLYAYDTVNRIREVRDGVAIRYPATRGPHLFFVAGRYRGERQDPLGGRYAVETLRNGRTRRHVDELNRVSELQVDGRARTVRTVFPEGDVIEQTFDLRGNVLEATRRPKPGGPLAPITVQATYGEAANVLTCVNPRICNKPTTHQDARGFVSNFSWDAATGLLTQALQPADDSGVRPQADYAYAAFGPGGSQFRLLMSITQKIDATASVVTTQTYSASNRFTPHVMTVDPGGLNLATTYSYDPSGNLTAEDGPRTDVTDVTNFTWDANRRSVFQISADPDGAGALPRRAARSTYDVDGQLVSMAIGTTTSATGSNFTVAQTTTHVYDAAGNRTRTAAPAGVVQVSYDGINRPLCTAMRMNPAVYGSLPSDACALSTQGANGPDRITRLSYDLASQLLTEERGYGTPLRITYATYGYKLNGQRDWVVDANGNRSDFTYDGFDRLLRLAFPTGAVGSGQSSASDYEEYTYDENNNRRTRRLRSGEVISFDYDALNRERLRDIPGGTSSDVYSSYDLLGRRRFARFAAAGAMSADCSTNSNGVDYCYDRAGRLLTEISYGRRLQFRYDDKVNRTRVTWPDGAYVDYTFDAMNRMDQVQENGATSGAGLLADYSYDALGRRSAIARGNGGATTYSYDTASRLSNLTQDLSGTAADATFTFTYNPASQVLSRALSNDAFGHALQTRNQTYAASSLNTISPTTGQAYAYDARGNLVDDGGRVLCYDLENHLTGTVPSGGNACSAPAFALTYDPLGRLRQTNGAATTQFLYDGDRLIAEYNGSDAMLRRYVHGGAADEPLVWYEGAGLTDRRWLHTNYQGSVIAVSNSSGALVAQAYSYGPWGEPDGANGWAGARFRYTGQIALFEAQLYHYKGRAYDPILGRFLQTDPVGYRDNLNLYGYVSNDPLNRLDATGLYEIFIGGGGDRQSGIVRGYARNYEAQNSGRTVRYFDHGDMSRIVRELRRAAESGEPVNIVGHSYGATAAARAAERAGVRIDNLVTIDPVGRRGTEGKPESVSTWTNVTAAPAEGDDDRSDAIAEIGGKPSALPVDEADSNETVVTNHGDFAGMMRGSSAEQRIEESYEEIEQAHRRRLCGSSLGGECQQ